MSNQLDLFHGVVLTTEQQEQVDNYIERCKKQAADSLKDNERIIELLTEAGFTMGVNFGSNFDVYEVTGKREFGYSYNNTNFDYEVTYLNSVGGVYLIVDTIKDGKIIKHNASVSREGDKLMCTNITDQYRYYKPSSLLTKLKESNKRKVQELDRRSKERECLNYTIAKYERLYPEANVFASSDYYKPSSGWGYEEFKTVVIEFKSGSSVTFRLGYGYENDQERLYKSWDAQKETVEQKLERFNNQEAK